MNRQCVVTFMRKDAAINAFGAIKVTALMRRTRLLKLLRNRRRRSAQTHSAGFRSELAVTLLVAFTASTRARIVATDQRTSGSAGFSLCEQCARFGVVLRDQQMSPGKRYGGRRA